MGDVHEAGRVGAIGKRLAPTFTKIVLTPKLQVATRYAGTYLDILQGKGAGTGWDMSGETSAATKFLVGGEPVIFDVGASVGRWSVALAALLSGSGRFFLVEPQRLHHAGYPALGLLDATFIRAAFSHEPGELELHSDAEGSTVASLYERHDTYLPSQARTEKVPVVTVDDELDRLGLDRVDLMKLDVEGAERSILEGASKSLNGGRIRTFAFEFGSANVYSRTFFRDLWDIYSSHGYRLWRICPGGLLLPIPKYREDLENFRGVTNYIASLEAPVAR